MNIILTLTTIPTRLSDPNELGIKSCINSLVNQSYDNYEIHFNIPYQNKMTGEEYIIPEWLEKESKIKIFRVDDNGPATKLLSTVQRITDPETIIIVTDDDLVYHEDMIKEHIKNQTKWPEAIVGYDGLRSIEKFFGDVRDYYFSSNHCDSRVDIVQHYKTASYKRRFFEDDFFRFIDTYLTWNDDLVISGYFAFKKRNRIITFLESEPEFKSLEEWQLHGGVCTFPVLRHTNHIGLEGCRLFRDNKVDDNGSSLYKFIDNGYKN